MSVTIKDVAKAAGVSVATVSRVLNKKANISDAAIEAVNTAVDELGYSPNFLGRDLRKCETRRILAIIASTEHSFYSEVIRGMQETAFKSGYDVLIGTTDDEPDHEMRLLNMLFSRSVDAAVLLGPKLDVQTINKLGKNYNLALCIERLDDCELLTVTIDNIAAAYDAVKCLINKGSRKVAMISTSIRSQSSIDREIGYKRALEESGIPFRDEYLYQGTYDSISGEEAVGNFLSLPDPPTAIFAVSDHLAMGAIRRSISRGKKVGKDIQIMGFDDITYSQMFIPSISTVRQPLYLQGVTVIKELLENLTNPVKKDDLIMLSHELVLRSSTGD